MIGGLFSPSGVILPSDGRTEPRSCRQKPICCFRSGALA